MAKKTFDFEKSMKRIREISEKMQLDELTLDESMKMFEEGSKLIEECQNYLETAELKVRKIIDKESGQAEEF